MLETSVPCKSVVIFQLMYTYLPTYVPIKNWKKAPTYLPKMPFRRIQVPLYGKEPGPCKRRTGLIVLRGPRALEFTEKSEKWRGRDWEGLTRFSLSPHP